MRTVGTFRKDSARRFALALPVAAALVALLPPPAAAQIVAPGRELRVISTERFDIYFPAELRGEAERLAAKADEVYAGMAVAFPWSAAPSRRLPVILSDQAASPGGGYYSYPSGRIALWTGAAPLSGDLGAFRDGLLSAFAHELAHALSLSSRSPFWGFWATALGDFVQPARWSMPASMIEGTAIAFEGQGGMDRGEDPLTLAIPRQDLLEGRFKDYWQAGGAWDDFPFDSLHYDYGGAFVADLVARGGLPTLGRLWEKAGEGRPASLESSLFDRGELARAYGGGFGELWEDFRIASSPGEAVLAVARPLTSEPGYITALMAGDGAVYWVDAGQGAAFARDRETGKLRRLFAANGRVGRLDLSLDGKRLLVSWTRTEGGAELPVLRVWDLERGRFEDRELRGLSEGAWAGGDGAVLALAARGSGNDMVLVEGEKRRVLLEGGPERVYGQPASRDGKVAYLLAKDAGRVLLVRFDIGSGQACTLVPGLPLERLRFLSVSRGAASGGTAAEGAGAATETSEAAACAAESEDASRLVVSFAAESAAEDSAGNLGLYRAAIIVDGPGGARLTWQEVSVSGSVLNPVLAPDGELFYVAQFSRGMFPCRFPLDQGAVPMKEVGASWAPLDPSFQKPRNGAARATPARSTEERAAGPLPLLFRGYRLPYVSEDLSSAGLILGGGDLAERLAWNLGLAYAWGPRAVDLRLSTEFKAAPWDIRVGAADSFAGADATGFYRSTGAGAAIERTWTFLPQRRSAQAGLELGAAAFAPVDAGAAYRAPYSESGFGARATARFGSERIEPFPPKQASGLSSFLAGCLEAPLLGDSGPAPSFGVETGLDAALPLIRAELVLRGAFAPGGDLAFGPRGRARGDSPSVLSATSPLYGEFADMASPYAPVYGYGELAFLLLSAELQKRAAFAGLGLPLYFQRFQARLGCRAGALAEPSSLADARILASTFLRMEFSGSPLIGDSSRFRFSLGVEAAYALTTGYSGQPLKLSLVFDPRL